MRYYDNKTKLRVKASPRTLGTQLAGLAIKHGYSVAELSAMTGACRQTVYHWFSGHPVSNAYSAHVRKLIEHIKNKEAV
jgi:hypothetical protein